MEFGACVEKITEDEVVFRSGEKEIITIKNDFVFAMTGYHPDHQFLEKMGVEIDKETGRPFFNEETMETNVEGIFIAGVIVMGNNANEIFIENGRFHGGHIAEEIAKEKIIKEREHMMNSYALLFLSVDRCKIINNMVG